MEDDESPILCTLIWRIPHELDGDIAGIATQTPVASMLPGEGGYIPVHTETMPLMVPESEQQQAERLAQEIPDLVRHSLRVFYGLDSVRYATNCADRLEMQQAHIDRLEAKPHCIRSTDEESQKTCLRLLLALCFRYYITRDNKHHRAIVNFEHNLRESESDKPKDRNEKARRVIDAYHKLVIETLNDESDDPQVNATNNIVEKRRITWLPKIQAGIAFYRFYMENLKLDNLATYRARSEVAVMIVKLLLMRCELDAVFPNAIETALMEIQRDRLITIVEELEAKGCDSTEEYMEKHGTFEMETMCVSESNLIRQTIICGDPVEVLDNFKVLFWGKQQVDRFFVIDPKDYTIQRKGITLADKPAIRHLTRVEQIRKGTGLFPRLIELEREADVQKEKRLAKRQGQQ